MGTIISTPNKSDKQNFQNSRPPTSSVFTVFTYSQGLEFILSHFSAPIFPRKISTYESKHKQFVVDSKKETLSAYSDSKYLDCRINAFPLLKEGKSWIPDLLFIDIDTPTTKKSIDKILSKTLSNITKFLGPDAKPTVLMSGNGYHVIQPVACPFHDYQINQVFQEFAQFCVKGNPAEEFLRFAKIFLSNGEADTNNNPSFRSCMLRIPHTINSKNGKLVQIISEWNGYKPNLTKELFVLFHEYLIQKKIDKVLEQERILKERRKNKKLQYNNKSQLNNYYDWIDRLLETPLPDCRKIVVGIILAPYLIKIKNLSPEDSFNKIREWLDKCNQVQKLDNNFNSKIRYALRNTQNTSYGPMSWEKIKVDSRYNKLYLLLVNNLKNVESSK